MHLIRGARSSGFLITARIVCRRRTARLAGIKAAVDGEPEYREMVPIPRVIFQATADEQVLKIGEMELMENS